MDTGVCDTCYDITKQIEKKTEFLWHAEEYLKDAKKANKKKAVAVFEKIIEDEKRHVQMLKELLKDGIC